MGVFFFQEVLIEPGNFIFLLILFSSVNFHMAVLEALNNTCLDPYS